MKGSRKSEMNIQLLASIVALFPDKTCKMFCREVAWALWVGGFPKVLKKR